MGSVMRGVSSGVGGIGAVKEAIGNVAGAITLDSGGVSALLQSVVGNLNATLTQVEQLGKAGPFSGGAGQELLRSFQSDLTRLAYIAALEKAVKKARRKGPFNVETAINDLWIALDGIRKGQQMTSPQVQNANDLVQSLTTILKQMNDTAGSAIQNMRI